MNEFLEGLKDYFRGWDLVRKHSLWPWLILPGLISLAYVPGIIAGTVFFVDDLEALLRTWLPGFLKQRVFSILITAALWLAVLYAGFILFRNIIMILYAPILSHVSAKVEEAVEGSVLSVPPPRFWSGASRAIRMSLLSLGLSLASLLAGLFLLLIPILGGLLMPIFFTITQFFLAGHGFMDPTMERHGYGIRRSLRVARANRWRTLGCGCGFVLFTSIPIVGWFLGPTIGIVAGTLSALEVEARSAEC